jgi:hypothetical protein
MCDSAQSRTLSIVILINNLALEKMIASKVPIFMKL